MYYQQLATIPRRNLTPAERAHITKKYTRFGLARFALPMLRGRLDLEATALDIADQHSVKTILYCGFTDIAIDPSDYGESANSFRAIALKLGAEKSIVGALEIWHYPRTASVPEPFETGVDMFRKRGRKAMEAKRGTDR